MHRAKSAYDAIRELNSLAGTTFQRELVEQFVQALGMFPTGSLVQLNTGEVGIVIEQNRVRRLRPKLMLLLQADKSPVKTHSTLDLRTVPASGTDPSARWIKCGLEPGAHGLDPQGLLRLGRAAMPDQTQLLGYTRLLREIESFRARAPA